MKILFFSYAYPNPIDPGLGTFNRTMIAGLAREHQVRVISPIPFLDAGIAWLEGRLPKGLNDSKFSAVTGVPAEYVPWYYTPKFFRSRYGSFMQRSVAPVLDLAMQEFQPDVVMSYWTHPDGEVAVSRAHRFGVRAVAMVGGSDVLINARTGSRRNAILDVLHAADGVITVSEDIKRVLISDGVAAGKLHVARRGIDRRVFHEGNRDEARRELGLPRNVPIVVNVGRLVDVKGHTHLIEACRLLTQRGLQFRCCLLGDGSLRGTLERQIERSGLKDVVLLKGSQTPTELSRWYRAADLSVLASLSEGVPNVLLESIACGTPFVASNVGGIPEIADLTRDVLVPASNPQALADAIAAQLSANRLSSRVPRQFEPPTMTEATNQISTILRTVVTGRPSLLPETPIIHETMTAAHLDPDRFVPDQRPIVFEPVTFESLVPHGPELCREGEWVPPNLSVELPAAPVNDASPTRTESNDAGSEATNDWMNRSLASAQRDRDVLSRTRELLNLQIETISPLRLSELSSTANSVIAQDDMRTSKSFDSTGKHSGKHGTPEDDELGRTAENFFYEP